MGSQADPPRILAHAAEQADAMEWNDPRCPHTVPQLWELIRDIGHPLKPMLCTDERAFDVPVRAWWSYESRTTIVPQGFSDIALDVSDEVWRRVQSQYALRVWQDYFGAPSPTANVSHVYRATRDGHRCYRPVDGHHVVNEVIENTHAEWSRFRQAVEMTANYRRQTAPNGPIKLFLGRARVAGCKVRVKGTHLEVNIESVVEEIQRDWAESLAKRLFLM